jgi:hypothetical protein
MNPLRVLVSKKKRRFTESGFDLGSTFVPKRAALRVVFWQFQIYMIYFFIQISVILQIGLLQWVTLPKVTLWKNKNTKQNSDESFFFRSNLLLKVSKRFIVTL